MFSFLEKPNHFFSKKENNILDNYMQDGADIKWEDTIEFTFPITGGRVIKVYDGDTITIASKLPFNDSPLYRLSVRLNGIDTPEIKGKSEDEKTAAKNARDALSGLILNKYITLKNIQSEKYGRILADIYINELHVNQWMIQQKYALPYQGKTKTPPSSWLKYQETGQI
jgi:micrococcal nuclease